MANPGVLRKPRVVNPGGTQKDFFVGRDKEFVEHRDRLKADLELISSELASSQAAFQGEGFIEVRLAQDAWAKSHRPVDKLFKPGVATLVGGSEIADLVFRIDAKAVKRIAAEVGSAQAEGTKKLNAKKNKVEVVVNELRSETGAIESVALWGPERRDAPSASGAIKYLQQRSLGAYYRVELFAKVSDWQDDDEDVLVADFWRRLQRLGRQVGVAVALDAESDYPAIGVALLKGDPQLVVRDESKFAGSGNLLSRSSNFTVEAHERLLELLTAHPLVRSISLPGAFVVPKDDEIEASRAGGEVAEGFDARGVRAIIAKRGTRWSGQSPYPRVCVVDGGIASKFSKWVIRQERVVSDGNEDHGSKIASLLIAGRELNANIRDYLEEDGCELIDMAMLPKDKTSIGAQYPGGALAFLDLMEQTIAEVKKETPFRIVNLSLNVKSQIPGSAVSESARKLDEIAKKHDLIFVVSAGNTKDADMREEWPKSTTAALQTLLGDSDRLYEPADTLLNISVAALNPDGVEKVISKAPARYSRRGTRQRNVKPDLCHFGGAFRDGFSSSGLLVMDAADEAQYVSGTSFAAPLVSKTLAKLDQELSGVAPREVLLGLLYHSARLHAPLDEKNLRTAAKQLVGFGLPGTAEQILAESSSSFTFVFFDRLKAGESFIHDFEWPESLTNRKGACTGVVRATLVSSPPIAHKFGAEAARMNVDLHVRQHNGKRTAKGEMSFEKRVEAVHSTGMRAKGSREASLVSHALKWSSVKVYEGAHVEVGGSSNWRFSVEYLERDKTQSNMPDDGVPVAVIVTISDPEGVAPVFDEMRASLLRTGLELRDIRAAVRTRART